MLYERGIKGFGVGCNIIIYDMIWYNSALRYNYTLEDYNALRYD